MSTPAERSLRALLEAGAARNSGQGSPWLQRMRGEAAEQFRAAGMPTTRLEDWRFTPLSRLEALELGAAVRAPAPPELLERARACVGASHLAVLASGRLDATASSLGDLPPGVRVEALEDVLAREPQRAAGRLGALVDARWSAFAALSLGLGEGGVCIEIPAGVELDRPLHLLFVHAGGAAPELVQPRVLLLAGSRSRAVVVEHHLAREGGTGLVNSVSELWLEPEARIEHVVLQDLPAGLTFMGALGARQERASTLASRSLALGADLARLESRVWLGGEGAQARLDGLYLARDSQLLDHHTTVDHGVPHTQSRQLYKGVLDERGRGVYHGRVHVRPGAQKSDAEQSSRTLLLSDGAQIDAKPQLEIHADDVRCSHGATIGQLDAGQLFYLRSRGIAEREARALLTAAFAREALEQLPLPALQRSLEARLLAWLPAEAAA